jgi:replicative DNA helicase
VLAMTAISLVAEASTLGAALLFPQQAEELLKRGHPELFTASTHQAIFQAIRAVAEEHGVECVEPSIVADELHRNEQLDEVGIDVLIHLDDGIVREIPMATRLARLWELWRLRQLALLGERLSEQCDTPDINSWEIISMMTRRIAEITAK